jgi:hypothetical protein
MHVPVWLLVGLEWAVVVVCLVLAELNVRRAVRNRRTRREP